MSAMQQALLMVTPAAAPTAFTMDFEVGQVPYGTDMIAANTYGPSGLTITGTGPFIAQSSPQNGVSPSGGAAAGTFVASVITITTQAGFDKKTITFDWNARPGDTHLRVYVRGVGPAVTDLYFGPTGGGGIWSVGNTYTAPGFIDRLELDAALSPGFGAIDNLKFEA